MFKKGDRITELNFKDSNGKSYCLNDFGDRKAVALFFYPMDFTRICTLQVCHVRDRHKEILDLGGAIFGISLDDDAEHNAFINKYHLSFPLIHDVDKKLGKQFGTLRLGGILRNQRATFVISPSGEILEVIHNELNAEIHADRFIEILKTIVS